MSIAAVRALPLLRTGYGRFHFPPFDSSRNEWKMEAKGQEKTTGKSF
jgi:hypothetical protein